MKTLFFQEQKLHRIEIVEDIVSYSASSLQAQRNRYPFQTDVSKDGVIAKGTTGYMIKRGRECIFLLMLIKKELNVLRRLISHTY
ncbi:hypothetical protein ACBZ92_15110 [Priestia aryabhattai]|uniref:hypothetical protein n=1 Tax=Priestia aryabhattai TaxID=412384 RepID=UPI0035614F82